MNHFIIPETQEDREVFLREHNAATFINAVAGTKKDADMLLTSVQAFWNEPLVLYVAMDYATHEGVTVQLVPVEADRPTHS